MNKIFTIGFTKKTAQTFFESLEKNNIKLILDVRLNNTSQLAGFSKYPDIKYFLGKISIDYISDVTFAPTEQILKDYKTKKITWKDYVLEFDKLMQQRNIDEYIKKNYHFYQNICLLCSEEKPDNCHRSLVANHFHNLFSMDIIHII